jgi:choline dehydrogenase
MSSLRSFQVPTVVKHGIGAIQHLAEEVKCLGMRRPLVVTDRGLVQTGIVDEVAGVLRAGGVDFILFDEVAPNPPIALVDAGAGRYAAEGCDGLIGLGGGSSMDTAKSIGVVAVHGGSIRDYEWADPNPISLRIPPLVAVPTTAGTGSEVTLWAVITDPERRIKYNVGGTPLIGPHVALLDPVLTVNLPAAVTAGTGMDALAHAIECYTCVYAQAWPDAVALMAMEYVGEYLRIAYAQGHNLEARYKMSMAAMLAGMAYGTESAGAAHAMSQTAGGVRNVPHGALTAWLLGPVVEYNIMGEPHKFARIARALGEDVRALPVWKGAERAVAAVYQLIEDLAIPSLQQLGFVEDDIPLLAELAAKDPQTIGNARDIDLDGYLKLYRRAFELGVGR